MLLILTALISEAQPIAKALALPRRTPTHWADARIHLHAVGIRAGHFAPALVPPAVCGIILAGLAGALDPTLAAGAVILDSASAPMPAKPPCRVGSIYCSQELLTTPQAKAALAAQTGALAVEMEAGAIRAFAATRGLPFMHIRAISDTAAEPLNPAVLTLVDDRGRVQPWALAGTLLRNPLLIPTLCHLGRNTARATANLARVVAAITRSGWPE